MEELNKEDINKKFGNIFREYRVKKGYTQAEIAEKLDISPKYISRVENGMQGVSDETLIKYINILDIEPNVLYSCFLDNENIRRQVELVEKINNLSEGSLRFLDEFLDLILKWSDQIEKNK